MRFVAYQVKIWGFPTKDGGNVKKEQFFTTDCREKNGKDGKKKNEQCP